MRLRLNLFGVLTLALCGAAALGQNSERIEFRADRTTTEFLEGGVLKWYSGNVLARSGDLELRADEAVYDSRIGETRLYGESSLKDSVRTVWADTLIYYDKQREAFARGNVRGIERARSFRAGWMRYRRALRLLDGFGGVTVRDDSIHSSVTGLAMAFNDSTRNGFVVGMPSIVREDEQGSIITLTASDTVFVLHDERVARIWKDVAVAKDSMTAHSARAFYDDAAERITLLDSPVIRHIMHGTGEDDKIPIRITSEVTGDTIFVYLKNRALSAVRVTGNAIGTVVATDSTGGVYYRSVLESRHMRLDMADNQVSEVTAEGVANSYYMHAPTEKGKKMFVNVARGDTIWFFFTDGHISDMRIRGMSGGDAVGKYYEYEPVKKENKAEGEDENTKKTGKRKTGTNPLEIKENRER
jgi:hypothetical protein